MAGVRLQCRRIHPVRADSMVSPIAVAPGRQRPVWPSPPGTARLCPYDRDSHQANARAARLSQQPPAPGHTATHCAAHCPAVVAVLLGTGQWLHGGYGHGLLFPAADHGIYRSPGLCGAITPASVARPAVCDRGGKL